MISLKTLRYRIMDEVTKRGRSQAAADWGVPEKHLVMVMNGAAEPSPELLQAIGYKRVLQYQAVSPDAAEAGGVNNDQ